MAFRITEGSSVLFFQCPYLWQPSRKWGRERLKFLKSFQLLRSVPRTKSTWLWQRSTQFIRQLFFKLDLSTRIMVFCCVPCLCSFPAHQDGELCLSSRVIQKWNRAVADRQKAWKDSYRQAGKCLLGVFLHSFYSSFSFMFFLQDGTWLDHSQGLSSPWTYVSIHLVPLHPWNRPGVAQQLPCFQRVSDGFREKLPKMTECKFLWKLSGIIQFICLIWNSQCWVGKSQVL